MIDGWVSGSLADDNGREWPVKQFRQTSVRGPMAPGTPNLTMHTTETSGYVEHLEFPSQWQCGEGIIGQHIREGLAGDAVKDWDNISMGVEMVERVGGIGATTVYLPPEPTLGPTVALTAWLHRTGRIKTGIKRPTDWPTRLDRLPAAVTTYYRRQSGLWEARVPGVYGHVEIPGNTHYDPASFDYPKFFARVVNAIAVQSGEDMSWADFEAGRTARRDQKPINATWPEGKKVGWRVQDQIERAKLQPEPATPGAHDHDDRYPTLAVFDEHEHNLIGKAK